MTLVGILAGTKILPIDMVILAAFLGAYIGDSIGFFMGRYYQDRLLALWPFRKHPHWVSNGKAFITKHGGKSIVIGRFIGPMRSIVPLVAGMLIMRWGRFLFAAIFSSILWTIAYMAPGLLIGSLAVSIDPGSVSKFLLIGALFAILLWLIFWIVEYFFYQIAACISRANDAVWNWMHHHYGSKSLIRFISNRNDPKDHQQLMLVIVATISTLLFFSVFYMISHHGAILVINLPLHSLLISIRDHSLNFVAIALTNLGDKALILAMTLLMCFVLCLKKHYRAAAYFACTLIVSAAVAFACKHLYFSARPQDINFIKGSSSFPSGHTLLAVCFYGLISFFSSQVLPLKQRKKVHGFFVLLILSIALSRLYLGAHWPTDILGSVLLGAAILLGMIMLYRRHSSQRLDISQRYWLLALLICIIIPWLGFNYHLQATQMKQYQLAPHQQISITTEQWWQNPTKVLPIYRRNRFNHRIQPFNLQWNDSLKHATSILLKDHWSIITNKDNFTKAVISLTSKELKYKQPLLPWLYLNKQPALLLVKTLGKNKDALELRLWKTQVSLNNNPYPLLIGTLNYHLANGQFKKIRNYKNISYKGKLLQRYLTPLLSSEKVKIIQVPVRDDSYKIKSMDWNGSILLVSHHR